MLDLDEALERFHQTHPEHFGGLPNHGAIVAEVLGTLGHGALRMGWVDVYAPRFPLLETGRPIPLAEQSAALGDPARAADWIATLWGELEREPWTRVLQRRANDWIDGVFAGAANGWLRVAHAVRALSQEESPARLRELAHGLGYWAARYQRLEGEPSGQGDLEPVECLELLSATQPIQGFFFDAARSVEGNSELAYAVARLRMATDLSHGIHELCVVVAELYLARPAQATAYVSAFTAASALRVLAPHLGASLEARAFLRITQTVLTLHCISGGGWIPAPRGISSEIEQLAEDEAAIRYRAACSLEELPIELAEAALRENAVRPHRSLRLAAAHAALTPSIRPG